MSNAGLEEKDRERIKGLEVKIYGNGQYGLDHMVQENKKRLDVIDEKLDNVQLTMVTSDTFSQHENTEQDRLDRLENRIVEKVDERLRNRERNWLKYLGPILTGIAAILAVFLTRGGV